MGAREPRAVLFACNWNTVRSPMAAALLEQLAGPDIRVESCGLEAGERIDPFAWAVMNEIGVDLSDHCPKSFDALGGARFDLIVTLSPEVEATAAAIAPGLGAEVETLPCSDPTVEDGSREQRLEVYRQMRQDLQSRLAQRFGALRKV